MTQHLMVEVDSNGTSVVYVPLFRLWEFLRVLPSGLAAISYHYQTNQAQVSFPGLRPSTAQQIVNAAQMKDGDSARSDIFIRPERPDTRRGKVVNMPTRGGLMKNDPEQRTLDNGRQDDTPARLLLVDDDLLFVNSLSQFLKLEGYQVDTAADGSQAIAMLATKCYRLMLMEVTDGLMLMEAIRNQYPDVVVLVITCYDRIERAEEAVKMGAFEYLVRPIIDDELRVLIQKALQQQMLLSENYLHRPQLGLRLSLDGGDRWRHRRINGRLRKPPGMAGEAVRPADGPRGDGRQ